MSCGDVASLFEQGKACLSCLITKLKLFTQVLPHRKSDCDSLFLSTVQPYLPVSASSLARWLASYLGQAGVDTSRFQPHATRAATSAYLKTEKKFTVKKICEIACWSKVSGVFEKFYHRYY